MVRSHSKAVLIERLYKLEMPARFTRKDKAFPCIFSPDQIHNPMNQAALLIIDMQKGSFTAATPRHDTAGVVSRINDLANIFRAQNLPVIFIQHDGSKEQAFIPHTEEWELLDELERSPSDLIISKTANDAFYQSDLAESLEENGITELLITGCATDFCVESTIQSALVREYQIIVVRDAHTTGERPELTAKQVIAHYNWIWENMIPTQGEIRLRSFEEIVSKE